eukprot:8548906-Pyramimonas_sp.AAC.1
MGLGTLKGGDAGQPARVVKAWGSLRASRSPSASEEATIMFTKSFICESCSSVRPVNNKHSNIYCHCLGLLLLPRRLEHLTNESGRAGRERVDLASPAHELYGTGL